MENIIYPFQFTPDTVDGGFTVTCRDFSEVITQGDTIAYCLAEAADCLEEAVASRIKRGVDIPDPSALLHGEQLVAVPLSMSLKAALYLAMKAEGISKSELARRMESDEKRCPAHARPASPHQSPGARACIGLTGKTGRRRDPQGRLRALSPPQPSQYSPPRAVVIGHFLR